MSNSVSQWLVNLRKGDASAAQQLWDRYFPELLNFARSRINRTARRTEDEEDVVLSVFDSLCRGAQAGRFGNLKGRDELWLFLLALTHRKLIDQHRHFERTSAGPKMITGESDLPGQYDADGNDAIEGALSGEPSPDLLYQMDDEWRRLLGLLRDDDLRRIANWRIEGYSVDEIAAMLGVLPRTVTRKLALIRNRWWEEIIP